MKYTTKWLKADADGISEAAQWLRRGEVVGIPTETVYGLAADATSEEAVRKIFSAKGRPQDNPLIVHISDLAMLSEYAQEIPDAALRLAEKFWPGPLTMVLKKKPVIPPVTSAGLDTVGIRFPSHPIAREIIRAAGVPLAAPSANLSGSPSPTAAQHVWDDMEGRIPAVVDGGTCDVGVESTVVSFEDEAVRILRPGLITAEELEAVGVAVTIDAGILHPLSESEPVRSPGMKYRHYSPKARIVLVEGTLERFTAYMEQRLTSGTYAMVFDKDTYPFRHLTYGNTGREQAHEIFDKLREFDKLGASVVYVRSPKKKGVGLAVYNRLLRAAGFEVVKL